MPSVELTIPAHLDPDQLVADLAGGAHVDAGPARSVRRSYFDTFDWRLHAAGLTLLREAGTWRLRDLASGKTRAEEPTWAGPWPRFAADFPPGDLRERLQKHLKVRSLIHLLTIGGEERIWRVRSERRRVVLRITVSSLRPVKPPRDTELRLLRLQPRRGHAKRSAAAMAAAVALGLEPEGEPFLDRLLVFAGLEPEGYRPGFRTDLSPDQSALTAAAKICRTLHRSWRCNEAGLKADVDTEFLHDFRVAIRRTRTALTLLRGSFAADPAGRFKREFAALGRLTGHLRDLDVYLLNEPRYRALLPETLLGGLAGLFDELRQRRRTELEAVRRAISAAGYRQLCLDWEEFLADPPAGPAAGTVILDLARRELERRHRRVLRRGRALGPGSADKSWHRLRLECKKLRYLLEFCASLLPTGEAARIIKPLKVLQDNLGEFNDLRVQLDDLGRSLATLRGRGRRSLDEAAALGGLITALATRQGEVRSEFAAAFAAFDRPAVARGFSRLIR